VTEAVRRRLSTAALLAAAYLPVLVSAPGRMPTDTKLYLYLDPTRLMSDASLAWDGRQFGGWVPHQVIAYLWPQGPWYVVMEWLRVPDWIAHRLWVGTLLAVAAFGVRWLARQLDLPPLAGWVAALAYMWSPYILPYVSRTSSMLLPWCALGWLIGLTVRAVRGGGWRDPALIALVVATVGAPNATALAMIVPGPALALVWEVASRRASWPAVGGVAARVSVLAIPVSLWWIAMLSVQRTWGADLLAYSETLEAVSLTSTSTEVWRGLGYWLFYVRDPYAFTTTASIPYMESGRVIAAGAMLLVGGLIGIVTVRWVAARLAGALVVCGVVLAIGAHPYDASAPILRPLVDSGLSLALRSSTRAVPLSSLGLALGLGVAVAATAGRLRSPLRYGPPVAAALLCVINLPVITSRGFVDIALQRDEQPPHAWLDAAAALDGGRLDARVLQLPGQEFGAFTWGYTVDPPLPGLTEKPMVTRDLLPLGSAPAMDLLYALDDEIQAGTLDPNSLQTMARLLAVDTLWLTNDIDVARFRSPRPGTVADLVAAAGIADSSISSFGEPSVPVAVIPMIDERLLAEPTSMRALPPVQLVALGNGGTIASVTDRAVLVVGSGDGVLQAAAAGVLSGHESVFYDASAPAAADYALVVITDSNRDQARQWRSSQDTRGFTESGGVSADVLVPDQADQRLPVFEDQSSDRQSVAQLDEGVVVRASGYGEPFAYRPEHRPAMAVDGDASTAWLVADRNDPVGEFIEISGHGGTLQIVQPAPGAATRRITSITVSGAPGSPEAPVTVVLTDASLQPPGQTIAVPEGTARLTIAGVTDQPGTDTGPSAVGFAELGPIATEVVRVPRQRTDSGDTPLSVVLTRWRVDPLNRWRSDPEPVLRRVVTIDQPGTFDARVTVGLDARATDREIAAWAGLGTITTADRRLTGSLDAAGWWATDGDESTAWTSPFGNVLGATLTVPLNGRPLETMTITQPDDQLHSVITEVTITVGDTTVRRPVVAGQPIDVPALAGDAAELTITGIAERTTVDRRYAEQTVLPVSIIEITSPAITPTVPVPAATTAQPECLTVATVAGAGESTIDIRLAGDERSALWLGERIDLDACQPTKLVAGEHRITAPDSVLQVDRISLISTEASLPFATARRPATMTVDRSSRTITVPACPAGCWLTFGEGFNTGWRATLDGVALSEPTLIDGGFNGWWLAPSTDERTVQLRWQPQRTLDIALAVSLLAVVACVVIATRGRRTDPHPNEAPARLPFESARHTDERRAVLVGGAALVVATASLIGPAWLPWAAIAGGLAAWRRRRHAFALAAISLLIAIYGVVVVRQRADRSFANAAWPGRFEDLHRPGVFAVCLLAAWLLSGREAPDSADPSLQTIEEPRQA
jgi:arabinofuranan 3-O-arabinosyltransferase